jgi:hypothetical protein
VLTQIDRSELQEGRAHGDAAQKKPEAQKPAKKIEVKAAESVA